MHHKGGKQIKFAPGVKSAGNTKGRVGFKGITEKKLNRPILSDEHE